MPYKCIHCDEIIEYLRYSTDASAYGTYGIESGDYDEDGCDHNGETFYSCPECDSDSTSYSNIAEEITCEDAEELEQSNDIANEQKESNTPNNWIIN